MVDKTYLCVNSIWHHPTDLLVFWLAGVFRLVRLNAYLVWLCCPAQMSSAALVWALSLTVFVYPLKVSFCWQNLSLSFWSSFCLSSWDFFISNFFLSSSSFFFNCCLIVLLSFDFCWFSYDEDEKEELSLPLPSSLSPPSDSSESSDASLWAYFTPYFWFWDYWDGLICFCLSGISWLSNSSSSSLSSSILRRRCPSRPSFLPLCYLAEWAETCDCSLVGEWVLEPSYTSLFCYRLTGLVLELCSLSESSSCLRLGIGMSIKGSLYCWFTFIADARLSSASLYSSKSLWLVG